MFDLCTYLIHLYIWGPIMFLRQKGARSRTTLSCSAKNKYNTRVYMHGRVLEEYSKNEATGFLGFTLTFWDRQSITDQDVIM